MSVYYKGLLYAEDEISLINCIELGEPAFKLFSSTKIDYISLTRSEKFLSEHEKKVLENFLIKEHSHFSNSYFVTDENIKKILNIIIERYENKFPEVRKIERKYDSNEEKYIDVKPIEIIFELFKDNYGNLYGKEIISNKIFPIFNENTKKIKPNYKIIKFGNRDLGIEYILCYEWDFNYPNVLRNGAMIFNQRYANFDEIEKYLNTFQGIGNINGIKLIELLTKLSKNVVFSSDFKIEKVEEMFGLDIETIVKNIEDLLLKLMKADEKMYLEYLNKYEAILDEKTSKVLSEGKKND